MMNFIQVTTKDPSFKVVVRAIANIFLTLAGLRLAIGLFVYLGMPFTEKKMISLNFVIALTFSIHCTIALFGLWKRYKYFKGHGRFPDQRN